MEENRNFSWSNLFIKVIIVVIFILFTIWLLSLSNNGLSNSLDVLTDNIFSQNIEKMKEVGKGYFTTERLPEKIGDVKTLTLEEMYEKKLILELKDKNGNSCSSKDSYVSIEKYEDEYQMKVYLECGRESDYIIVIMGCYDYCENDICELKPEEELEKEVEYQYKKTTGGRWTDYGNWSNWSKVSVTNTNYRQVETKKEIEEYTYDKEVTNTVFEDFEVTCPSGYSLSSDGTKCEKLNNISDYKEPVCLDRTSEGYTLLGRNGFTCSYTKTVTSTADPVACPDRTSEGYTLVGRDGLTCKYSKTVTSSTEYDKKYLYTTTGSYVPKDTKNYSYELIDADYVYSCTSSCAMRWIYTYKVYMKVYKTSTITDTKVTSCPVGFTDVNGVCTKYTSITDNRDATCPVGYTRNGIRCVKSVTSYSYEGVVKSCPTDYNLTSDGTKCYKDVTSIVQETGTREVTYYRYRVREYINGVTDYKWSKSNNDKELLDAGYKLTGKTR